MAATAVLQQQEHQQRQIEQPPVAAEPHLLDLPDILLHLVLSHLTTASELASAAATCSTLRALIKNNHWQHISTFQAHSWTPGLPNSLQWAASHCPRLREVDISGANACCDADLLPLVQLSTLTCLRLAGMWRIQGKTVGANAGRGGQHRSSVGLAPAAGASGPALNLLSGIIGANRGLLSLDLSGTAVPVGSGLAAALAHLSKGVPNATKPAHGLQQLHLAGCRLSSSGAEIGLQEVLLQCRALTSLDLSGCHWATAEALPQGDDARSVALGMLPLRRASFAGCELLGGIGWLVSSWQHLESLDLSGTAVDDVDLTAVAQGCPCLHSINLSACLRIKGPALLALSDSPAVQLGCLTEVRLADLAWVQTQHLAPLLHALASSAASAVQLDLSGCGGLSDASLLELVPPPGQGYSQYHIEELRLASSSRLTAMALLQLSKAECYGGRPWLQHVRLLDFSHVQSLGGNKGGTGSTAAADALGAVLESVGSSLRQLTLDGCFVGGALLPRLAQCCTGVTRLSLVGCSGVGDADMAALGHLIKLRDVAVGGASLAWHEHRSLTGLSGLSRLRISRRPFLMDAQLAPVLAANQATLVQLELAGCAALTDQALLPLLPVRGRVEHLACGHQAHGQDTQPRSGERNPQLKHDGEGEGQQQMLAALPALQHLQLVCCERLRGSSLRHLARLRSLRLSGCPAITESAIQALAVCCTQLTLLELPSHIPRTALPVAPAGTGSHLLGLQVLGGGSRCTSRGRRGGRRS